MYLKIQTSDKIIINKLLDDSIESNKQSRITTQKLENGEYCLEVVSGVKQPEFIGDGKDCKEAII